MSDFIKWIFDLDGPEHRALAHVLLSVVTIMIIGLVLITTIVHILFYFGYTGLLAMTAAFYAAVYNLWYKKEKTK